ncbi:MAG: hypothetical protein R2854_06410 [Caldilineaceae bacterium]
MNTYETLQQKALGLAFVLAPLLMVFGSAAYVLGIGLTPFGTDSWVDGVFAAYGFLLMIPVTFELARILGQRAPVYGLICAILGLGWGMSTVAAALKIVQMGIVNAGLDESIWTVMETAPGSLLLMLPSLLAFVGFLALGTGLLWKGGIPRWAAVLMIAGSVLAFVGVAGGAEIAAWQTKVLAPLATVAYLAALAPIGLRYLAGDGRIDEPEPATA